MMYRTGVMWRIRAHVLTKWEHVKLLWWVIRATDTERDAMEYITLVPAYTRDYKSARDVRKDWDAGKDFQVMDAHTVHNGRYVNSRDFPVGAAAAIRYNNLTRQMIIYPGKKGA